MAIQTPTYSLAFTVGLPGNQQSYKTATLPDIDAEAVGALADSCASYGGPNWGGAQSTMMEGDVMLVRTSGGSGGAQILAEFDAELSFNPNYLVVRKKYG